VTIPDPVEPEPEPILPLTLEELKRERRDAYRGEADPLFFKVQRGEATLEQWTALIAEIKARYPYPT
jgi:hypothetical protein